MIDNTRIRTGFDVEINIGGDYLLTVIQGAYDAGEIPNEISTGDDPDQVLAVGRPTSVRILASDDGDTGDDEADVEVIIPMDQLIEGSAAVIGLHVTFVEDGVDLAYAYIDDDTRTLIEFMGLLTNQPNLFEEVEADLREALDRHIDLDLVSNSAEGGLVTRKLPASGDCQAAFGLYLNLDLKIAPQSGPPEDDFIERGDVDRAVSFLPEDLSFAIGLSPDTFPRLANDMWHGLGEEQDDGSIDHPVKDGDTTVGEYRSVAIAPRNGFMEVTVRSRIFIDIWPDADVTAVFHFTPTIDDGVLSFDIELTEFDADTGLVGDLLAFLIGGVIGLLIGLFFGPVGIAIGASIGGVGGIATLEITEEVVEGQFDDQVEEQAQNEAGVASALSAFPVRKRLFTDDRDPFFMRHFEVVSLFEEARVNDDGLSLGGTAVMETVNEPVETTIVDRQRGDGPLSRFGLLSLTYRLEGHGDIPVPITEILRRRPLDQIQRVRLRATNIRRHETVVTDVRFQSGVDLHVQELVNLQDNDVLVVAGYQLIHPRDDAPYYRAWADQLLENNFESLPPF
jgi:hypothetical protein